MQATEIITIAVSVIIVVILISTAFLLRDEGLDTARSFNDKIAATNIALQESDKLRYSNTLVTGADVVNAINRFVDDGITVEVSCLYRAQSDTKDTLVKTTYEKTKPEMTSDATGQQDSDSDLESNFNRYAFHNYNESAAINSGIFNEYYINPAAQFVSSLSDSGGGYVSGIIFKQVEYVGHASKQNVGNSTGSGGSGTDGSGSGGITEDDIKLLTESLSSTINELAGAIQNALNAYPWSVQSSPPTDSGTSAGSSTSAGSGTSAGTLNSDAIDTIKGIDENLAKLVNYFGLGAVSSDAIIAIDLQELIKTVNNLSGSVTQLESAMEVLSMGTSGSPSSGSQNNSADLSEIKGMLSSIQTSVNALATTNAQQTMLKNVQDAITDAGSADNPTIPYRLNELQEAIDSMQNQLNRIESTIDVINNNTGGG